MISADQMRMAPSTLSPSPATPEYVIQSLGEAQKQNINGSIHEEPRDGPTFPVSPCNGKLHGSHCKEKRASYQKDHLIVSEPGTACSRPRPHPLLIILSFSTQSLTGIMARDDMQFTATGSFSVFPDPIVHS